MQAAQRRRDGHQVVHDPVSGQRHPEGRRRPPGEGAVRAAEQQRPPEVLAPVAVDRHDLVDVMQEARQGERDTGITPVRRNVPAEVLGLAHRVQRGAGAPGRVGGDLGRPPLEAATVQGHEPEP
jgi:hypothetical protein